ncbi:AP-2 complex subunit sigma, partial [Oxyura jamaicensis]|uniref:AP-2 complex subunit sigma n=1 Tax=Oxyura jamaicensis TaxID=8884 RepID=UPI0015A5961E
HGLHPPPPSPPYRSPEGGRILPPVLPPPPQVLNEYFHNVCELDLVFNFYKVYTVVDEMFLAGEIRETSQTKVLKQLLMLQSLE